MPAVSDQFRLFLYIFSALCAALLVYLSTIVGQNIIYFFKKYLPGEDNSGEKPDPKSPATWILFGATTIVSILGAGIASTAPSIRDVSTSARQMSGDYRVIVIPFSVVDPGLEPGLGTEIASDTFQHLSRYLTEQNADLVITIWGPDDVKVEKPGLREKDAAARAERAADIASLVNADLVIYGSVDKQSSGLLITPEYFIRTRNFYAAEEILGEYNLGSSISIRSYSDLSDRVKFADSMNSRTHALSQVIMGLSYYGLQDYSRAFAEFQKADEVEGWGEDEGKQVLYLLMANAALRQGSFNLAEENFYKSLNIDDSYSRPWLGLGNIYYRRALLPIEKSNNPGDLDTALIETAQRHLNRALSSTNQPLLADIPAKVSFEYGQINLALAYGGFQSSYDPALLEFNKVIAAYGNGDNPRILERAAEAHARIGLIYSLEGKHDDAVKEYRAAVELLAEYPERQQLFKDRIQALMGSSDS